VEEIIKNVISIGLFQAAKTTANQIGCEYDGTD
jgi:hypothetical protein